MHIRKGAYSFFVHKDDFSFKIKGSLSFRNSEISAQLFQKSPKLIRCYNNDDRKPVKNKA